NLRERFWFQKNRWLRAGEDKSPLSGNQRLWFRFGIEWPPPRRNFGYRWWGISYEFLQRRIDNFVNPRHWDNFEFCSNVFRDVFKIRFVTRRQDDPVNSRAMGRQHFLLDAPDRKDQT